MKTNQATLVSCAENHPRIEFYKEQNPNGCPVCVAKARRNERTETKKV